MAKQSIDSLSIATVSIPTRIDPPSDLSARQKELWRDVMNTKPPEWFEDDTYPLLRAYVTHVDTYERLSQEIQTYDLSDPAVDRLIKLQDLQGRAMGNLAVKMRLTQQSRYTPKAAATANKKAASGKKPWEK